MKCVDDKKKNLTGKFCPFPVVAIICAVTKMAHGEEMRFVVDDPQATRNVPEELDEFPDVRCSIRKHELGWEIVVLRD